MHIKIKREIEKAEEFGERIENLVVAKGRCPAGDRNTPLMAYWSLAFDFHKGILFLLSQGIFGSAFALLRPIVEASIRAHVVIMCSEQVLRELQSDEYRTNLGKVGKEIDAAFHMDGVFENFLNQARGALHSYTHAGLYQLGRRFSGDDLVANYRDEETVEVIRTSTSAVFMVTNLVTKHLGFEEDWKLCSELFGEWGKHDH